MDAGIFLTYLIHIEWSKDLHPRTLTFDIAQFFPFLNYQLLPIILNKASFDFQISYYYLINRQMQCIWNYFVSPFFKTDVSIDQGSAFSPILSTIYIASIFHIFKNRSKMLLSSISVLTLSFVDNSLLIS